MAPKLSSSALPMKKISNLLLILILGIFIIPHTSANIVETCNKPKCYHLDQRTPTVKVKMNQPGKEGTTTSFCFDGLHQSLIYLWANPVLKIARHEASINESSKFVTYFGMSLSDVNFRRKQTGYALMQSWVSSMRSLKQSEDFSLTAFNRSCLIIDTNVDYTARLVVKVADLWYVAYLAAGILIFFSAKTWSHNTKLHYGAGVSVGVFASLLILVFVLMKLLPSRLKTIGYLMMAMGTSATFWMFSSLSNIFGEPVTGAVVQYWQYILGYCFVMGFLSFALVYRYGPVTEERTLNLIQWFLQMIGLTLIYNSTQIQEVSVALILITLAVYNFPRAIIFNNQMSKNMWLRFFPPKIKLLTEDEYITQGNRETKNELEKLREYCRSPNCQAWKIISKLKSPSRFAEFVQNGAWHIRNEELVQHPNGNDSDQSDNELPSDTESELVFVLGSESMRVPLQD